MSLLTLTRVSFILCSFSPDSVFCSSFGDLPMVETEAVFRFPIETQVSKVCRPTPRSGRQKKVAQKNGRANLQKENEAKWCEMRRFYWWIDFERIPATTQSFLQATRSHSARGEKKNKQRKKRPPSEQKAANKTCWRGIFLGGRTPPDAMPEWILLARTNLFRTPSQEFWAQQSIVFHDPWKRMFCLDGKRHSPSLC